MRVCGAVQIHTEKRTKRWSLGPLRCNIETGGRHKYLQAQVPAIDWAGFETREQPDLQGPKSYTRVFGAVQVLIEKMTKKVEFGSVGALH